MIAYQDFMKTGKTIYTDQAKASYNREFPNYSKELESQLKLIILNDDGEFDVHLLTLGHSGSMRQAPFHLQASKNRVCKKNDCVSNR